MEEAGDGKGHDTWVCLWMLYIVQCMIMYIISFIAAFAHSTYEMRFSCAKSVDIRKPH